MDKFLKKNKIVDCLFFYDEIEMLKFRIEELKQNVDYFIVLEGRVDFRNNKKDIYFNIEDSFFDNCREKIIHLIYDEIDKNSLESIYKKLNYEKKLHSFDNLNIDKFHIMDYALFHLREKILSLDLDFDDLIMISDVDEIPDLTDTDIFTEYIKFDTIILRQKNFVWSYEFYDAYPHLGTRIYNKSKLVTDPRAILFNHECKFNMMNFPSIIVDNGFHFSHFYDYERTLNKLSLMYEPSDNVSLTKSEVLDSMKNLIHPCQIKKLYSHTLIEYSGPTPKNINLLNNQTIGRVWSKNFLVLINPSDEVKKSNTINDYHKNFLVNFTEDYTKKTTEEFGIFIPKQAYYSRENYSLDKFKYTYGINEINKLISRHLLLSHDFVIISLDNYVPSIDEIKTNLNKKNSYFDTKKKYAILKWDFMRNNILSDIISEIL